MVPPLGAELYSVAKARLRVNITHMMRGDNNLEVSLKHNTSASNLLYGIMH
jgi:hypothetical protein